MSLLKRKIEVNQPQLMIIKTKNLNNAIALILVYINLFDKVCLLYIKRIEEIQNDKLQNVKTAELFLGNSLLR